MFKFIVALSLLVSAFAAQAEIIHTKKYIYVTQPSKTWFNKDRQKIIGRAKHMIMKELKKALPGNAISSELIEQLRTKDIPALDKAIDEAKDYIQYESLHNEKIGSFLEASDIVPTGFMLLAGGKISANFKIGGGGSGTFALLVIPTHVQRINKLTKEVYEYDVLRASFIFMPKIDVGGGVGGGATLRFGAGLMWGMIEDPSDFVGTTVGMSANLAMGIGNNIKFGALMNLKRIKAIYSTFTWEAGPSAEASVHFNMGAAIAIREVFMNMTGEKDEAKSSSEPM